MGDRAWWAWFPAPVDSNGMSPCHSVRTGSLGLESTFAPKKIFMERMRAEPKPKRTQAAPPFTGRSASSKASRRCCGGGRRYRWRER